MKNLGKYQVVKPLARAGADEVLLARTLDSQGADYHMLRWIEGSAFDGARRAAWLRHPNLIAIRELGSDRGRWFVATEYVHGEDLRRLLACVRRADDQVPIALVTAIGAAAAAGLHHAHTHHGSRRTRHGSVHGALSPSSIVIGYDGSIKLTDLGVVVTADASYQAPEQVSGDQDRIDRRTDVFVLGILLYELATARRLFKMPTDFLTQTAIVHASIPPPSRFRRGLPRALEAIIMKALAPAPEKRFRSAGELGVALEAFARGLGMRQSPEGIADYLKKLCGTRPFPWLSDVDARNERAVIARIEELQLERAFERADDQPGVAAPPEAVLRELGVPEALELEVTPGRGTKTPMAWTSQTVQAPPWSRRRSVGLMAGAAVVAAILAFFIVGAVVRDGGEAGVAPASAPRMPPPAAGPVLKLVLPPEPPAHEPPPPPPAPAPAPVLLVVPDASPGDGSASAPAASAPAASAPAPAAQPAVRPVVKPTVKPVASAAKPARKTALQAAARPAASTVKPATKPATRIALKAAARPAASTAKPAVARRKSAQASPKRTAAVAQRPARTR